jgi:hypothetical protein
MADPGQLEGLSEGICSSKDKQRALDQMVVAFAAAFRATETGRPGALPPDAAEG